jgi:hypothetical protein
MGAAWFGLLCGLSAGAASLIRELVGRTPLTATLFCVLPALLVLSHSAGRWRRSRWFARIPGVEDLGAAQPGTLVRLVGTVELSGQRFRAPGSDRNMVWTRTLFWESGHRGRPSSTAREEVRGVPFRIRLAGGGLVHLQPKDVTLTEEPRQLRGVADEVLDALGSARRGTLLKEPRFLQATLAEGDRVEAVGHLHTEVSVHGEAAPTRGSPLVHTLVPPDGSAVLIRPVTSLASS